MANLKAIIGIATIAGFAYKAGQKKGYKTGTANTKEAIVAETKKKAEEAKKVMEELKRLTQELENERAVTIRISRVPQNQPED